MRLCEILAEETFSILAYIVFQKSVPIKNFLGANLGEHD